MRHLHSAALAGAVALAATTGPAAAVPFVPVELLSTITIPVSAENNQGGLFTAFDISFVDPTTGLDYVADRSNAAIDVFGNQQFLGRTPGTTNGVQTFAGQQATTSVSGPDGVLVTTGGPITRCSAGMAAARCERSASPAPDCRPRRRSPPTPAVASSVSMKWPTRPPATCCWWPTTQTRLRSPRW